MADNVYDETGDRFFGASALYFSFNTTIAPYYYNRTEYFCTYLNKPYMDDTLTSVAAARHHEFSLYVQALAHIKVRRLMSMYFVIMPRALA